MSWFLSHAATSAPPPPPELSSFGIFLDLGARFSAFISRDAIFYKIQMRKLDSFTRSRSMLAYSAQKLPQIVKKWIRKNTFRAQSRLFGSFEKPSPGAAFLESPDN